MLGGERVGLASFDWSTGVSAQAYDLTVEDVHNYFVATDADGAAVLVHNANSKWTCGRAAAHLIDADPSLAAPLKALDDALDPAVADELGAVVDLLDEIDPDLADRLLLALANSDTDRALRVAQNAATDPALTQKIASANLVDEVLGGSRFARLSDELAAEGRSSAVGDAIDSLNGLQLFDLAERSVATRFVFESERALGLIDFVATADGANLLAESVLRWSTFYPAGMLDDALAWGTRLQSDIAATSGVRGLNDPLGDSIGAGEDIVASNPMSIILENLNAIKKVADGDSSGIAHLAEGGTHRDSLGNFPPAGPPPSTGFGKSPDYNDSGFFVDAFSPNSETTTSIFSGVTRKIDEGQAQRVDIILERTSVSWPELKAAFDAEHLADVIAGTGNWRYVDDVSGLVFPTQKLTVLDRGERYVLFDRESLGG